jgi:hypothetical protein
VVWWRQHRETEWKSETIEGGKELTQMEGEGGRREELGRRSGARFRRRQRGIARERESRGEWPEKRLPALGSGGGRYF